jgi:DNA polymerase III subunit delta'
MSFVGIIGQDSAIAALRRSLASGRIAHAYLFSGIDGCGKKKTAQALIGALFCKTDREGCGTCPSCRKVAALQHPDLRIVEPDGAFIKIDQIRELQRELAYRPFEAGIKACIIDEADRMNPAAANSLLKTLEEPPGNAVLILITATVGGMLPTIRSRCQQLQFRGLSPEHIESYLTHEGNDPEAARLAAALADGSLGKAMGFVQKVAVTERTDVLERFSNLTLTHIEPLFAYAEELSGDKERALTILDLLTTFMRDVMLAQKGNGELVNLDLLPLIEREAARIPEQLVLERLQHVAECRRALLRNINARLALEVLCMRVARAG